MKKRFIPAAMLRIMFVCIDLFCGAGGTTTGMELAEIEGEKIADVVACVNHDPLAISSHYNNHPNCHHFVEDIRKLDAHRILPMLQDRIRYWEDRGYTVYTILWASLECTNFSNAKGGKPRDADSRTLAEHLFPYIDILQPHFIKIENVREFLAWGPLDENGKPISRLKGVDYERWVRNICSRGYQYAYKLLNAADVGARTTRTRYFGFFAMHGLPTSFPKQTHFKNPKPGQKKWKPVREVLELDDVGHSIFNRETNMELRPQDRKPFKPNSLKRIYYGLVKHIAGGEEAFMNQWNNHSTGRGLDMPSPCITTTEKLGIVNAQFYSSYYSGSDEHRNKDLEGPIGTVTTENRFSLISSQFIGTYYGGQEKTRSQSLERPSGTLTTNDRFSLITSQYLNQRNGGNPEHRNGSIEDPAKTITTTGGNLELVSSQFLGYYYSGSNQSSNLEQPSRTVSTKDRINLVTADQFIMNNYSGGGTDSSLDNPSCSMTAVPKSNLVSPIILDMQFDNTGRSSDEPSQTILASRNHHYILNPQFSSKGVGIDQPCFTLIARMDKKPPSLVSIETGEVYVVIYETDCYWTRKIKEFMALYGITDIKMRMLKVSELKQIMGFPADYVLRGSLTHQKKFIGNAVEVNMAKAIIEAQYMGLMEAIEQSIAA